MKRLLFLIPFIFLFVGCGKKVYKCDCRSPVVKEDPVRFHSREFVLTDLQGEEGVNRLKENAEKNNSEYREAKQEYELCEKYSHDPSQECSDELESVKKYSVDKKQVDDDDYWAPTKVIECYEQ